eukprot:2431473-Alexandrium_andersonii.AAC.1
MELAAPQGVDELQDCVGGRLVARASLGRPVLHDGGDEGFRPIEQLAAGVQGELDRQVLEGHKDRSRPDRQGNDDRLIRGGHGDSQQN